MQVSKEFPRDGTSGMALASDFGFGPGATGVPELRHMARRRATIFWTPGFAPVAMVVLPGLAETPEGLHFSTCRPATGVSLRHVESLLPVHRRR